MWVQVFFSESQHPHSAVVYKLLLAIGQPQRTMFLECRRIRDTGSGWNHRHYQYEAMQIVGHRHVPFTGKDDIMVIPQMCCRGNSVYAVGVPVSLSYFARFHRVAAPESSGSRTTRTRRGGPTDLEMLEKLQNEFPWLTLEELLEILDKKSGSTTSASAGGVSTTSASASGGSTSASASASRTTTTMDHPEDVFELAAAELVSLREQYGGYEEEVSYFTVRVLGGDWSVIRSSQTCTDIGAYATDKQTKTWCSAVGWPASKTFAVRKHGGVENSRRLSLEMCSRGNHFMKGWIDSGSVAPFSFEGLKVSYRAPASYNDWRDDLVASSAAFQASMHIETLCPRDIPPP